MEMFNVRSRMFRPTSAPVNQAYGSLVPTYIHKGYIGDAWIRSKFDTTCFSAI